jgi:hypothetical protein
MASRIRLISAAAAVLIVGRAADRGEATVVRDGPGNPAVQTGGQAVRGAPTGIQYTILSGFQPQSSCAAWPWTMFNPFFRHNPARVFPNLPGRRNGPFSPVPPRLP